MLTIIGYLTDNIYRLHIWAVMRVGRIVRDVIRGKGVETWLETEAIQALCLRHIKYCFVFLRHYNDIEIKGWANICQAWGMQRVTEPANTRTSTSISATELRDIGIYLNDGREYGWQGKLAALLKKNNHTSISKWMKNNAFCWKKRGIDRISSDDIQHMRLLVLLKQRGMLQEFLIAAQSPFISEDRPVEPKPVRAQIAEALEEENDEALTIKPVGRWG